MRFRLISFLLAVTLAGAGRALAQRGPLDRLLDSVAGEEALRPRLFAFADSVAGSQPRLASEALSIAGQSFARHGELDSAVTCYTRAVAFDGGEKRRLELAEAMLARLGPGDAQRARDVLRPVQPITPELPDPSQAVTQGLFAWALFLSGQPDSAARLLAPAEPWLSTQQEWRYRLACVSDQREEWIRVQLLLTPLGVASRTYDRDVMDLLSTSADKLNAARRLKPMLAREIHNRDLIEQALIDDLGGRRIAFRAPDGFPLAGTVLAPPRAPHARMAVVVVAPGDTLALYDSLAVGLRHLGLAVILLDPRGSGRSVGPSCPLPGAWRGRESAMVDAVAGDVAVAATALAREVGADSTQYLAVGVGTTGPIAVAAAVKDPRVRLMMLVSPTASPCERGALRAAVAAWKRPIYFQTAGEDLSAADLIDLLYRATDMRVCRVAESDRPGTRAKLFRRDPQIMARFKQWMTESWPRSAPRSTRPPRPKTG